MIGTRFYGRCGNVLFQAAHCIAFALKNNEDFSMPNKTNDPYWNPLYLQHLVNPNYIQGQEDILINENGHQWQPVEYQESWRGKQVVLNGYWQTEKYFKEYRTIILDLFDFPYTKKDGYISVHVRRGDYLHLTEKHPPVTKEWYERAMSMFPECKFKFFSDDIVWCKQTFGDRPDCEFSTNGNEVDDLVEASCCEHNICSASTFSFWIYWLNRNEEKKGIFPQLWFSPGWCNLDTSDILPPEVIKL
jgi:hypothetical protein